MNNSVLDNIAWHALNGPHRIFSSGASTAKRYAKGFSPIVGYESCERPDFSALQMQCDVGEHLYCSGWTGSAVEGWDVLADTSAYLMIWEQAIPELNPVLAIQTLQEKDLPQVLELAAVTHLDPFGPRAMELGAFLGIFSGDRLVAMGGERMFVNGFREISSVATHPEYQGRGYARGLMGALMHQQLLNQEMPFLHVMRENNRAYAIYQKMGFTTYKEIPVRVIARVK
jgi:predicted GNAT family acetyltransferase